MALSFGCDGAGLGWVRKMVWLLEFGVSSDMMGSKCVVMKGFGWGMSVLDVMIVTATA